MLSDIATDFNGNQAGSRVYQKHARALTWIFAKFGELWRTQNDMLTRTSLTFSGTPEFRRRSATFIRVPVMVPSVCWWPSEGLQGKTLKNSWLLMTFFHTFGWANKSALGCGMISVELPWNFHGIWHGDQERSCLASAFTVWWWGSPLTRHLDVSLAEEF